MRALLYLFALMVLSYPALAQDTAVLEQKLLLSKQMVDMRPVKQQVEAAIDLYINKYRPAADENTRAAMREKLLALINIKELEQTTIDAYAETFTLQELQSMVAYFGSAEGKSAAHKQKDLSAKITPEIIEMIDGALMRFRLENTDE